MNVRLRNRNIMRAVAHGVSLRAIGRLFGLSAGRIGQIRNAWAIRQLRLHKGRRSHSFQSKLRAINIAFQGAHASGDVGLMLTVSECIVRSIPVAREWANRPFVDPGFARYFDEMGLRMTAGESFEFANRATR